jgi:hypothetical protein
VKNNKFFEITNSEALAVGVIIVDDPTGAIASGNEIENNTFEKNDLDVYDIASGKGNEVKNNACTSSIPDHLCS